METAANGGADFSGAFAACVVVALLGLVVLVIPDIMHKKGWRWIFGLSALLVRLFPENWRNTVARFFGALMLITGIFLAIAVVAIDEFASTEGFRMGVGFALSEEKHPYSVTFEDGFNAKITYPRKPGDVFRLDLEDRSEDPPEEVAAFILEKANEHFQSASLTPASPGAATGLGGMVPGGATASVPSAFPNQPAPGGGALPSGQTSGAMQPVSSFPPQQQTQAVQPQTWPSQPAALTTQSTPAPAMETLADADRCLEQAHQKWLAGDYNGSILLAQKALDIKTRILGENHEKVIQIKTQLANAKLNVMQKQLSPGQVR